MERKSICIIIDVEFYLTELALVGVFTVAANAAFAAADADISNQISFSGW